MLGVAAATQANNLFAMARIADQILRQKCLKLRKPAHTTFVLAKVQATARFVTDHTNR